MVRTQWQVAFWCCDLNWQGGWIQFDADLVCPSSGWHPCQGGFSFNAWGVLLQESPQSQCLSTLTAKSSTGNGKHMPKRHKSMGSPGVHSILDAPSLLLSPGLDWWEESCQCPGRQVVGNGSCCSTTTWAHQCYIGDSAISKSYSVTTKNQDWKSVCPPNAINGYWSDGLQYWIWKPVAFAICHIGYRCGRSASKYFTTFYSFLCF